MKTKMIWIIVLFVSLFTFFCEVKVYAIDPDIFWGVDRDEDKSYQDPITDPDQYKPDETSGASSAYTSKLMAKAKTIINIINAFGVVISVVTLMIVGIRYMFCSIEEKAEYKKTAINYCIGALLVFGTTTIVNILYNLGINIA